MEIRHQVLLGSLKMFPHHKLDQRRIAPLECENDLPVIGDSRFHLSGNMWKNVSDTVDKASEVSAHFHEIGIACLARDKPVEAVVQFKQELGIASDQGLLKKKIVFLQLADLLVLYAAAGQAACGPFQHDQDVIDVGDIVKR